MYIHVRTICMYMYNYIWGALIFLGGGSKMRAKNEGR